jgi:hypothetical protein
MTTTSPTTTKTRSKLEVKRFVNLVGDQLTIRMVHSGTREEVDTYTLSRKLDRSGYLLIKPDGTIYRTELNGPCTCPGFTYHEHCKHGPSLGALQAQGRLS